MLRKKKLNKSGIRARERMKEMRGARRVEGARRVRRENVVSTRRKARRGRRVIRIRREETRRRYDGKMGMTKNTNQETVSRRRMRKSERCQ